MCHSLQTAEVLMPNVMAVEMKHLGGNMVWWGHEVRLWSAEVSAFIRRHVGEHPVSLPLPALVPSTVKLPWEDGSLQTEESPHQNPTRLAPLSQTFSLQNGEKLSICCLSHPIHGFVMTTRLTNKPLNPRKRCTALLVMKQMWIENMIYDYIPTGMINLKYWQSQLLSRLWRNWISYTLLVWVYIWQPLRKTV